MKHPHLLLMVIITLSFPLYADTLHHNKESIAEGIAAFLSSDRGIGNVVQISGSESSLIVDASSPSGARSILEQIQLSSTPPIRYLVHTHWHDDHVWGAKTFQDAHPGITLISTTVTRKDFLGSAIPALNGNIERLAQKLAERDALLKRGIDSDGVALTDAKRAALESRQAMFRQVFHDLSKVQPVPPEVVFDGFMGIFLGDLEVHLLQLGEGHTPGDLVVYVPSKGVLAAGDLVTLPIPSAVEVPLMEWLQTLEKLSALDFKVLIPGHGPVQTNRSYLELLMSSISEIIMQVRAAVNAGKTLEQTHAAVNIDTLRERFHRGDEAIARAFDRFFLKPAVDGFYNQLSGVGTIK